MSIRIQLRRDTAAHWLFYDSMLALGELGLETDTLKVKLGDGINHWSTLGYLYFINNDTLANVTARGASTAIQSTFSGGLKTNTLTAITDALGVFGDLAVSGNVSAVNFTGNSFGFNSGDQDLSGLVPKTTTVNGHLLSSNVSVSQTDVGLSAVNNTSDVNKPVSTAQQNALNLKVDTNVAIVSATKTKLTYDTKGLVTSGDDATTADISDSVNRRYVNDAELSILSNIHKGSIAPLLGSSTVTITGLALPSVPSQIFVTENVPDGSDNIPFCIIKSSRTTDGFSIKLEASLPNSNYQFDWMVLC